LQVLSFAYAQAPEGGPIEMRGQG